MYLYLTKILTVIQSRLYNKSRNNINTQLIGSVIVERTIDPIVSRKYILSEIFVYQTNPIVTQFIGRIGSAMQDICYYIFCRSFLSSQISQRGKKRLI